MWELITRQLFLPVLSLSLSGTLTGILIAAIRPFTRNYFSKKWNYYIWLLVVARLLIPFHFGPGFPGQLNFHAEADSNYDTAWPGSSLNQSDSLVVPNNALTPSASMLQPNDGRPQSDVIGLSADGNQTGRTAQVDSTFHDRNTILLRKILTAANILTAAAFIWITVAVLVLLFKLLHYGCFQNHLKKNCTRITDNRIIAMESAFCTRLRIRKMPILYESASMYSPMTIGLRKPRIILPKALSTHGSTADSHIPSVNNTSETRNVDQLQLILHHELIHVARKDLWYKWIYQLLLCVHWFNPVLHRIGRQISSDCELSCDEAILPELTGTGRQMYGNILLNTAEQAIACRQNAFSTTLLENKRNLKRRLDAILRYKKATRFRLVLSACAFAFMLVFSACGTIWISAADMPASESEPDSSPADSALWNFLTNAGIGSPDDSWEFYDNEEVLAGKDIYDNWEAFNYVRNNNQHLTASRFTLYGTDSFAIVYADRDIDVQITSSFEITDGKFKIIHVAPDKSVTTLNDTGAKTTQAVTMQKGRNVLKMVGQGKKLNSLEIDYSGIRESDFENIFFSEDEEYVYQAKDGLVPVDKDKLIDTLYALDEKDASELFNTLLSDGTSFTEEELCTIFMYSDRALSSAYLAAALRNKTIEPLSPEMISAITPYLTGDCQAEILKSLPVEDFYDAFAASIMYLDSSQREECLMDYLARGGALTFSMYDEISYLLDKSTKTKLDQLSEINNNITG